MEGLSKYELLKYRILRRRNKFNETKQRFVTINNITRYITFVLGKINNEEGD
jgi:hypothetical protein